MHPSSLSPPTASPTTQQLQCGTAVPGLSAQGHRPAPDMRCAPERPFHSSVISNGLPDPTQKHLLGRWGRSDSLQRQPRPGQPRVAQTGRGRDGRHSEGGGGTEDRLAAPANPVMPESEAAGSEDFLFSGTSTWLSTVLLADSTLLAY